MEMKQSNLEDPNKPKIVKDFNPDAITENPHKKDSLEGVMKAYENLAEVKKRISDLNI